MKEKDRFLNFPIALLQGFLDDHKRCLDDIFDYAMFRMLYSDESNWDDIDQFKTEFSIELNENNTQLYKKRGELLFNSFYGTSYAWTGIHIDTFWNFYKHRSEFDLVCLLLFLALKSIIQMKSFTKTSDALILSRMSGFNKVEDAIPERIHYWMKQKSRGRKKVFAELEKYYGLVRACNTRGTTFSLNKLTQVELELAILKKKDEQSIKKLNEKKKLAKAEAIKRFKAEKGRKPDP